MPKIGVSTNEIKVKANTSTLNLKALEDKTFRIEQGIEGIRAVTSLIEYLPGSQVTPCMLDGIRVAIGFIADQVFDLTDDVHEVIQDALPDDNPMEGGVQ